MPTIVNPGLGGQRGVLFDVDGTLVDSTYLHTISWWQAFRRMGHDVPMASIHRAIGMGGDKLIAELLGDGRDTGQDETLKSSHDAVFATFWPALRPFAAAKALLTRVAESGLRVVLASSAKQQEFHALQQALDADEAVFAATGAADAEESKPAPDILEAALKAGDLEPENVLFVGDAVWDVYASAKLGIACIGLTCGGTSAAELTDAGASEVYRDPQDLLSALPESAIGALIADIPRGA